MNRPGSANTRRGPFWLVGWVLVGWVLLGWVLVSAPALAQSMPPTGPTWVNTLGDYQFSNDVLLTFQQQISSWGAGIEAAASRLFWILATISLAWTFATMALRGAGLVEFFAEFVRFTVFTGLFYWLLDHGPEHAEFISVSMRQLAAQATGDGDPTGMDPSGLLDLGFRVFGSVLMGTQWTDPFQVVAAIPLLLLAMAVLVVLTLICANMLSLLIAGWFLAYGGIFFLGFGGARWLSDMAVGYYKSVLALSMQAFGMILVAAVGEGILRDTVLRISSSSVGLWDLAIVLVVVLMMDSLMKKVPPMLGSIAGGSASMQWGRPRGVRDAMAEMMAKARFTAGSSVAPVTVARHLRGKR